MSDIIICSNPDCDEWCGKWPQVCSKCKSTPYCSRECQVKHWRVHKKQCTPAAADACKIQQQDLLRQNNKKGMDDVTTLFKVDLLRDTKAPGWYKNGGSAVFYISDERALQYENHERKEYLHSNLSRGGGRKPEEGQRVIVSGTLPNGSRCDLVGTVVKAFDIPSDSDLKRTRRSTEPSEIYGSYCSCTGPECRFTKTGRRFDIVRKHGAVHTQQVKATVKLTKGSEEDAAVAAFFGASKRYDILLRCNDTKKNMWEMAKIEPRENMNYRMV